MKYKKTMILLVLAIFIFGGACVCASDVNDTVIAHEDDSIVELSQADADEIMLTDENELISQTDNGLISEGKSGTFAELQINITQAKEGSTLTLNKNYECEDGFDSGGILINKSITIDGQGNKIDAQGKSRIFKITAENVILKNIIFTNGKTTDDGGAVYFNGTGEVTNCNFVDNKATGDYYSSGGAVYFNGTGEVTNCNFTDNSAKYSGGAVYFNGTGEVTNCNFTGNTADDSGAVRMSSGNVSNCNFTDNEAYYGGAVGMSSGNVSNCNFTDNTATGDGGAVYFISNGEVTNCTFADNTATYFGGAVLFNTNGEVTNCTFVNNYACEWGGAVYFRDGQGTVSNCNFTGNIANGVDTLGGAISMPSGNVSNCNFVDNTATGDGGAVYFWNPGTVSNCNFTGNTASREGGAVRMSSGNVSNCNFVNNSASTYGGAVRMSSGNVSNCNFTGNTATEDSGAIDIYSGTVTNCNFTGNSARNGGAVNFYSEGNVSNCNFTGNTATEDGGAVYFNGKGDVANCNFTGNNATGDDSYGGAIYIYSGTVTNCNFTGNSARNGGAVYFYDYGGSVSNCNFTNNSATENGGAVYFSKLNYNADSVTNCNFTGNSARNGGAVYFYGYGGSVSNCTFVNNSATGDGGAVYISSNGIVTNCNFTGNTATRYGGAISRSSGTVSNCNFTNNSAGSGGAIDTGSGSVSNCNFADNTVTYYGGAVFFDANGEVTNCNFTGNNATNGSAIYFGKLDSSDTLTVSDSTFLNNRANAGALDIVKTENNITITFTGQNNLLNAIYSIEDAEVAFTNVTYWGAKGITTVSATMSGSNKAAGQKITVGVVVNDKLVLNDVIITNETGTIVLNISAGENYYISARHNTDSYYTEAERTISNNTKFNVNVTSQTTNNKTVNITAESNIPNDVVQGKLLFILPNGTQINATYGANGTWWAVHEFDKYDVYQVNATYVGLDNVTINNGTITINKVNSTISLDNIVLDYGESENVTVITTGATGITAKIGESEANVTGFVISIPALDAGTYTLTVTTIPDDDYNPVTKEVDITVNKVNSTLTVGDMVFDYGSSGSIIVSVTGEDGVNATVVGQPKAVVKVNGTNITVSGLDAGTYTLTVTAIGDKNHNNITKNATITVNKVNATLTVNDVVLDYGESKNVTVIVDGASAITAKIGESEVNVTGFVISIPALDAGTYILTVTAIGDKNHNNITKNATITVNKLKTELTGNAITTTYNVNKDLVITLKDITGKALSGVKVTVDLNGAKTYTTDKNGQVKVSTKGIAPKAYTAKVTFNGDTNYDKSTKDIKVTVKKATPKLTAKKKTYKTTPKTKKYTIVLKDNTGKAIKKAKVTLKVKGKTYKATTNSKGKATFKITKLNKKGTFKATITYKGNKYYNKVSKKSNIKVIVTFKTVSKGSKDKATVKEIQRALKNKGYYLTYQGHYLKVDGKFNSCTFRSIKEFQHDKGLKVTGKVDEKTAKKLGIL